MFDWTHILSHILRDQMRTQARITDAPVDGNCKNCQLFPKPIWNAIQLIVIFFVTTYRWWLWAFILFVS